MNKLAVLFIGLSITFGAICFLASNNLISGIAVGLISIVYFLFIALPRIKKFAFKQERFNYCYTFINTFIISLSIKGAISPAYDACLIMMNDSFKEIIKGVDKLTEQDKLQYLKKLFPFDVFTLFLNIVNLYENQGGDIIQMSNYLVEETRNIESYISSSNSLMKKNIIEFSVLWLISLAILIVMRFTLSSFYLKMSKSLFFILGVSFFFLFVLVSIDILIRRFTKLNIKGWNDHEKHI